MMTRTRDIYVIGPLSCLCHLSPCLSHGLMPGLITLYRVVECVVEGELLYI